MAPVTRQVPQEQVACISQEKMGRILGTEVLSILSGRRQEKPSVYKQDHPFLKLVLRREGDIHKPATEEGDRIEDVLPWESGKRLLR